MSQELDLALADLQAIRAATVLPDLCGWWMRHGNTVKSWARRLQKFPFSLIPGGRKLGRLIEDLASRGLDPLCGTAHDARLL